MKNRLYLLAALGWAVVFTALVPAASAQVTSTGSDWLQGYADATNSGFSPTTMTATPRLIWGFSGKSKEGARLHPDSGSAVHNGVLFTSADKNPLGLENYAWSEFYAFDTSTGSRLWTFDPQIFGAKYDGLVAVDAARSLVLYPAHDGYLRALDESTGALVWALQLCNAQVEQCDLEGGVTLANGRAYYVSKHWTHAIVPDRAQPFEIWRFPRGDIAAGVATKPVVWDGKVFFGGLGRFWALDELTGAVVWHRPTSLKKFTYGFTMPHVWNDTVYASASRAGFQQTIVTARDAGNGTTKWERVLPLGFAVKSSIGYGKWFISFSEGSSHGGVIALDLGTGSTVWKFDQVGGLPVAPTNGGPVVVDNKVIFGAMDGTVYMLDQATGNLLWSFETGETTHSAATVADGRFFIGSRKTFRAFGP